MILWLRGGIVLCNVGKLAQALTSTMLEVDGPSLPFELTEGHGERGSLSFWGVPGP